jgi:hypothetical protein
MDFEDLVAGPPHNHTHRGIAAFLKLYYDGRTELPANESNGNNPVSRYKVAADSWRQLDALARRTGDAGYARTRDLIAGMLPTGSPETTRDLAAQTIGLCQADPRRFAPQIEADVRRILDLQLPDGNWPIQLSAEAPPAQMQTGECLYALALAGLDAAIRPCARGWSPCSRPRSPSAAGSTRTRTSNSAPPSARRSGR